MPLICGLYEDRTNNGRFWQKSTFLWFHATYPQIAATGVLGMICWGMWPENRAARKCEPPRTPYKMGDNDKMAWWNHCGAFLLQRRILMIWFFLFFTTGFKSDNMFFDTPNRQYFLFSVAAHHIDLLLLSIAAFFFSAYAHIVFWNFQKFHGETFDLYSVSARIVFASVAQNSFIDRLFLLADATDFCSGCRRAGTFFAVGSDVGFQLVNFTCWFKFCSLFSHGVFVYTDFYRNLSIWQLGRFL